MAHDDGAAEAAAIYFRAWLARDFARLRAVLADDVDFAGPFGQGKITRIRVAFDPRGF